MSKPSLFAVSYRLTVMVSEEINAADKRPFDSVAYAVAGATSATREWQPTCSGGMVSLAVATL
jgi:hypothetical protein